MRALQALYCVGLITLISISSMISSYQILSGLDSNTLDINIVDLTGRVPYTGIKPKTGLTMEPESFTDLAKLL